jgi:hypothetical protein
MGPAVNGYRNDMSGEDLSRWVTQERPARTGEVDRRSTAMVALTFPADYASIRLARLVASGVGAELRLDVVSVENLRLVVDEACAILLECSVVVDVSDAHHDALDVAIGWTTTGITIEVSRPGAVTSDAPSSMSVAVLDALVASWTVDRRRAHVSIDMARTQP